MLSELTIFLKILWKMFLVLLLLDIMLVPIIGIMDQIDKIRLKKKIKKELKPYLITIKNEIEPKEETTDNK